MNARTLVTRTLCAALLAGATLTNVACGPKAEPAKTANVTVGAMPAGEAWTGVYYNQMYGFLHLIEQNGAVTGAWRRTAGDKWGELWGEVEGNVLRFQWKEYTIGVVGPNSTAEGKGVFVFKIVVEGEPSQLEGHWGLGEDEAGGTWDCLKQNNMEADPKSVRPDELESRVGAVGFDGSQGDAEAGVTEDEAEEEAEEAEEVE